ncbi:hypothetical protein QCA50_003700 [Cerrena zonata]|uniref:Uncharacterized protein n=1 Tax=Cerrena zonata TaxID=2478898 RepID=A0AAW0GQL0_9APHY
MGETGYGNRGGWKRQKGKGRGNSKFESGQAVLMGRRRRVGYGRGGRGGMRDAGVEEIWRRTRVVMETGRARARTTGGGYSALSLSALTGTCTGRGRRGGVSVTVTGDECDKGSGE